MKYRLLDILACPHCKTHPLDLIVFKEGALNLGTPSEAGPYCEVYCGLRRSFIKELGAERPDCRLCLVREVEFGILKCRGCNRWYPINEGIPEMLPDHLRSVDEDKKFLRRWEKYIPRGFIADT